jgi:hypothetical protein
MCDSNSWFKKIGFFILVELMPIKEYAGNWKFSE